MDNDGINTLTGGTNAAGTALFSANVVPLGGQGYGGADAYYTNVVFGSPDTGTVNFLTPIAANGGTDFFSQKSRSPTPIPLSPQPRSRPAWACSALAWLVWLCCVAAGGNNRLILAARAVRMK